MFGQIPMDKAMTIRRLFAKADLVKEEMVEINIDARETKTAFKIGKEYQRKKDVGTILVEEAAEYFARVSELYGRLAQKRSVGKHIATFI